MTNNEERPTDEASEDTPDTIPSLKDTGDDQTAEQDERETQSPAVGDQVGDTSTDAPNKEFAGESVEKPGGDDQTEA